MKKKTLQEKMKLQYSKFKFLCESKHIPVILFPSLILLIVGGCLILLGGYLAGWDIIGGITSDTAILVYAVAITIIIAIIGILFFKRYKK